MGNKLILTNEQKVFLNSYCPKDKFFTSLDEIEMVSNILKLSQMSSLDMVECRNAVVEYYSKLIDNDKSKNYMCSLMSVTSVIDYKSNGFTA